MLFSKIIHAEKIWILIFFIIALIIFIQSNFPSVVTNENFYSLQFDKITHISAWVCLSFSLRLGTNSKVMSYDNLKRTIILILLIAIGTLYGISDEIHQYFIPSRSADILDVLADCIGSTMGVLVAHKLIIVTENKI